MCAERKEIRDELHSHEHSGIIVLSGNIIAYYHIPVSATMLLAKILRKGTITSMEILGKIYEAAGMFHPLLSAFGTTNTNNDQSGQSTKAGWLAAFKGARNKVCVVGLVSYLRNGIILFRPGHYPFKQETDDGDDDDDAS